MKVLPYSNFSQKKKKKKRILQAPWGMEDFTFSSVASKNGGAVHPFFQKAWSIPQTSQKKL
jgi:hypothetical protein